MKKKTILQVRPMQGTSARTAPLRGKYLAWWGKKGRQKAQSRNQNKTAEY